MNAGCTAPSAGAGTCVSSTSGIASVVPGESGCAATAERRCGRWKGSRPRESCTKYACNIMQVGDDEEERSTMVVGQGPYDGKCRLSATYGGSIQSQDFT